MNRNWFKPFSIAVLAFSLVTASCDSLSDPTVPAEQPSVAQQTAESSPRAPQSFSQFNGPLSSLTLGGGYHLVQANNTGGLLGISNILGILGGTLNVGGHTLVVPAGAVLQPTLFTMLRLPSPYIQVQLTAVSGNLFNLIDIGGRGFEEPVQLSLSYANAIGVTDPSHLRIAELKWNGTLGEVLPTTYDATNKTVTAYLPHFSSWVIICN
jgi:hypothetical protein